MHWGVSGLKIRKASTIVVVSPYDCQSPPRRAIVTQHINSVFVILCITEERGKSEYGEKSIKTSIVES